ncbi:MAG: hypothetical protein AAGI91_14800 [Bacteroidota bacterium]
MDPGLHVKQAINHLDKILGYYPFVQEGGAATVALTPEDWQVVADAMFRMSTPREVFPSAIEDYTLTDDHRAILLTTADCTITVEMG